MAFQCTAWNIDISSSSRILWGCSSGLEKSQQTWSWERHCLASLISHSIYLHCLMKPIRWCHILSIWLLAPSKCQSGSPLTLCSASPHRESWGFTSWRPRTWRGRINFSEGWSRASPTPMASCRSATSCSRARRWRRASIPSGMKFTR